MTDAADQVAAEDEDCLVTAHQSAPERTVFTEEGNSEGWIATDLAIEVER